MIYYLTLPALFIAAFYFVYRSLKTNNRSLLIRANRYQDQLAGLHSELGEAIEKRGLYHKPTLDGSITYGVLLTRLKNRRAQYEKMIAAALETAQTTNNDRLFVILNAQEQSMISLEMEMVKIKLTTRVRHPERQYAAA